MGESQLSCQRVTSNNQQPTTTTTEMKLLFVLGAFFAVTLGSPVAEPEAEAAASPTADADAEASSPSLLWAPILWTRLLWLLWTWPLRLSLRLLSLLWLLGKEEKVRGRGGSSRPRAC